MAEVSGSVYRNDSYALPCRTALEEGLAQKRKTANGKTAADDAKRRKKVLAFESDSGTSEGSGSGSDQ